MHRCLLPYYLHRFVCVLVQCRHLCMEQWQLLKINHRLRCRRKRMRYSLPQLPLRLLRLAPRKRTLPSIQSLWVTVCVSACPVATDTVLACQPNSVVTSCVPHNGTSNTNSLEIYNTTLGIDNHIQLPIRSACPLLEPSLRPSLLRLRDTPLNLRLWLLDGISFSSLFLLPFCFRYL